MGQQKQMLETLMYFIAFHYSVYSIRNNFSEKKTEKEEPQQ